MFAGVDNRHRGKAGGFHMPWEKIFAVVSAFITIALVTWWITLLCLWILDSVLP